jgi:hypothetical protein
VLPLQPIRTKDSPREILTADCKELGGGIPIRGGWGYTKEDACIIDKNDPIFDPSIPFDGIRLETMFVEKRIYAEMITFRPIGEKFLEIRWKPKKQQIIQEEGRVYEKLTIEITAFHDRDWHELKSALAGQQGYESPKFNPETFQRKMQEKMVCLTRDFWFDVTSFYEEGRIVTISNEGLEQRFPKHVTLLSEEKLR